MASGASQVRIEFAITDSGDCVYSQFYANASKCIRISGITYNKMAPAFRRSHLFTNPLNSKKQRLYCYAAATSLIFSRILASISSASLGLSASNDLTVSRP